QSPRPSAGGSAPRRCSTCSPPAPADGPHSSRRASGSQASIAAEGAFRTGSSLSGVEMLRPLHVVLDPPAEERVADDVAVLLAKPSVGAKDFDERVLLVAKRDL